MSTLELATTKTASKRKRVRAVAKKKPAKAKAQTATDILQKALKGNNKAAKPLLVTNAYAAGDFYDQLRRAGFDLDKVKSVEFEDNDVYAFTKAELTALLEKANLYISKKTPSRTQNVEWVWFNAIPKLSQKVLDKIGKPNLEVISRGDVKINDSGNESAYAYIVATMLYPLVKRPIKFTVPHGDVADYKPDGPFQIYIWSTPTGGARDIRPPYTVWGIETLCRDDAFVPDARRDLTKFGGKGHTGVPICDGTYAVAELFPNALYVHHDLVHHGERQELELFAELLDRCRPLLMGPDAFEKYRQEMEKARLEAEKKAFPLLIEKSVQKRARRQKAALEAAERIAKEKKQAYFEAERTLFAERQALLDPEVMKARFLEEYMKLREGKVALIEGVTFNPLNSESITLHTGEILVEHPRNGRLYRLGKCDVTFKLETGDVNIVNRTHTFRAEGQTFHSPHVFDEGRVCLGNIGGELAAYIAHYELEAAAVLTVAFLQSVQDGEGYLRHLELFPIVDKKEPEAA